MKSYDDYAVPKKHWLRVLSEVPDEYLGENVLYMIRLWSRWNDEYYYKLGFTNDLGKRIIQLNNEFDSCGRIIIIMLSIVKSEKRERTIHKTLKKHNVVVTIQQKKKTELYQISSDSYDDIKCVMGDEIFETDRYVIDDDDYETLDGHDLTTDKFWHKLIFQCK